MDEPAAIELIDVTVRFDGRAVLRDFSLRVAPGEKVALTGPSGSGKSTVLRCVLGFVVPESGQVRVSGTEINAKSVWAVRRLLAFVAQEPDLGRGTVQQVLRQPFAYQANAAARDRLTRTGELFDRFNLPRELLDKDIATLSGGEKQRVALVSAVLLDRRIILLDEASSALDRANKLAVAEFFRADAERTVLSVSHDTEWFGFSDRIVELTGAGK